MTFEMWVYCDRDSSSNSNNNNNNNNRRVVLFARGAGATALVTGAAKNVGKYHDDHDDDREEHEEHEEHEGKGGTTQEAKEAEQEENSREGAAFQWSLYLTPAKEGYRLMFQTSASKEVVAQKDEEVRAG